MRISSKNELADARIVLFTWCNIPLLEYKLLNYYNILYEKEKADIKLNRRNEAMQTDSNLFGHYYTKEYVLIVYTWHIEIK